MSQGLTGGTGWFRKAHHQSWTERRELIAALADRGEARATSVMRAHTEHTRRMPRGVGRAERGRAGHAGP
ncbi:hypothetical protein [Streptomyces lydicus]|uniref:hypothetical protein n=1 Tax=Streptomyces lydicus TaxID=47763 RepID=UPI0036FC7A7C